MGGPEPQPAAVLADLRSDLLRGDLGQLGSHLEALSDLEARIATGGGDPGSLAAMRAEAERCREILLAAAAGVRAALRRLGEAGSPPTVYDPDGRRVALGDAGPAKGSRA